MKKIVTAVVCIGMIVAFGACGGGDSGGSGGSAAPAAGGLTAKDMNIEDFEWDVDEAKIEGLDCYALTLTNNSKYDLLGAEIKYRPKADVTEEQLSVFDSFMEKHKDYANDGETTADVMLRGQRDELIPSGGTASNIPLAVGFGDYTWYDSPTEEEFELMEPVELTVLVIDKNTAYVAYYDIPDDKWKIDTQTGELNTWPKIPIAKIVPKPEGHVYKAEAYENINSLNVYVYGVTQEDFDTYVAKAKEAGFTETDLSDEDYFDGEDDKGNSITVDYEKTNSSLEIDADGEMEE